MSLPRKGVDLVLQRLWCLVLVGLCVCSLAYAGKPKDCVTAEQAATMLDKDGLGTSILPRARDAFAERLKISEAWEDVSNAAMGETKKSMEAWMEQLAPGTQDQQ